MSAQGGCVPRVWGVSAKRGSLCPGGVCPEGCLPRGWGDVCPSACWDTHPLWTEFLTHACENYVADGNKEQFVD